MANGPDDDPEPEIYLGCDRLAADHSDRWPHGWETQTVRIEELQSSVLDLRAKLEGRVEISDANIGFYAGELDELAEAVEMSLAARGVLDDPGKRVEALTRQSLARWETRVVRGHEALEEGDRIGRRHDRISRRR